MIRKLIITIMAIMFVAAPLALALADQGPDGNKRKGKYTYRKVYKACAESGEVESASPTISPADKKMAEWKDIFENRKFDEFGCVKHWESLADKDILDIYTYFYKHAADSASPAQCQ
jgi:hypothetical protein